MSGRLNPLVARALAARSQTPMPSVSVDDLTHKAQVKSHLAQQQEWDRQANAYAGTGGGVAAAGPVAPGSIQSYVQQQAASRGWSGQEWDALSNLIQRESSWNPKISNPSSRAYGLFQFMPMHWKPGGYLPSGPNSTLQQQVDAGLRYIQERYGSPLAAWQHWQARKPINGKDVGHWY